MAYNKKDNMKSKLSISHNSREPREDVILEFTIWNVTLLREKEDKTYPNSISIVERITRIAEDEKNVFNVFRGLTMYIMRSYHNKVKRDLLRQKATHLLDVRS